MRANRRVDTKPELEIRSRLHRLGFRFRKDYLVRPQGLRVKPDIVFPRRRVAIFVDGCFWHRCPIHGKAPARNSSYWLRKLNRNVERDRLVDAALRGTDWKVIRVWEHEDPAAAVARIAKAIR